MFDQEKFTDRLLEQMTLNELEAKDLARETKISHSIVCNLRKGRYAKPSTEVLFTLIEYFNCSAVYMLGLLDFPPDNMKYYPPLHNYNTRIRALLKEKSITQERFEKEMKISSFLVYKWLYTDTLPTVDYLIKLAEYFEMSVDVFIQRIK